MTGWFLLAGKADERFVYRVRTIRDGGISTRGVDVVQESDPGICFTCICSFKSMEVLSLRVGPYADYFQNLRRPASHRSKQLKKWIYRAHSRLPCKANDLMSILKCLGSMPLGQSNRFHLSMQGRVLTEQQVLGVFEAERRLHRPLPWYDKANLADTTL